MEANLLLELKESEFQLWRHQPITKAFLQYLRDHAQAYRSDLMAKWEGGALVLSEEDEIRGIVRTLDEVAELPLTAIHRFYTGESDET